MFETHLDTLFVNCNKVKAKAIEDFLKKWQF
jgi:hypothetical protein